MNRPFHLSIGCKSIPESKNFFTDILNSKIVHEDPTGYVNIDFYGTQITLKPIPEINPKMQELHFGVNLKIDEFEAVSTKILSSGYDKIIKGPMTVDEGTDMERSKMYIECPTGYIFEIKGYPYH